MGYQAVNDALSKYQWLLGNTMSNTANNLSNVKMDYAPVNPYSSGAYTPRSSRNIYTGEGRNIPNPVAEASNLNLSTGENLMLRGAQGLQYAGIADKMSPYLKTGVSSFGQNYLNTAGQQQFFKVGAEIPQGYTAAGTGTLNLGPAAAVYGMTRNQNPYDYTSTESLGTTASTMMAANQLAGLAGYTGAATTAAGGSAILGMNPYVAIGAFLLSSLFNKKGKKAAKRRREEVKSNIEEQQQDIYSKREEQVREGREEMQSNLITQMYEDRASRYDNQYGGNYDARAYAEDGMKMDKDIVAEFTGNELIVNEQSDLEKALANKNYSRAASYIKKAMKGGKITPGPETHQGNPMPVDSEGNIYAGGGTLPFKATKGSGIYDHATDQFKPTMTDKEIAMVAQNNINKWESNGMA